MTSPARTTRCWWHATQRGWPMSKTSSRRSTSRPPRRQRPPPTSTTSATERAGRSQPAQSERAPMPLWRKLGIVGSCLLIAVGAVILVVHSVQARQPGQASSGSVTLSQAQLIEQQLNQANTLNQQGSTKAALELYNKVLSEDPSNPAALAYAGFLQWNVGTTAQVASLVRIGRAEIETADQGRTDLLPGPPLLRARSRQSGSQRRSRGGAVQRLPGRRASGRRAAPGHSSRQRRLQGGRRCAAVPVQLRLDHDHHLVSSVAPAGRRRRGETRGRTRCSPRPSSSTRR